MDIDYILQNFDFANIFWQFFTPIIFSIFDVITGYISACINNNADSKIMRKGLLHKVLLILLLIMAFIIDIAINITIVSKFISIYIIVMEITSILENLQKAGIEIPKISNIIKKKGDEE